MNLTRALSRQINNLLMLNNLQFYFESINLIYFDICEKPTKIILTV